MKRLFHPTIALTAMVALVLGALPAGAHGSAAGGFLAGLAHPFLGLDHLLMLLAIGAAASQVSLLLLPWALGGGVLGAVATPGGGPWPLMETLGALAIVAVASLVLWSGKRHGDRAIQLLGGVVVGSGLAIHGMLHGLKAPTDDSLLLWWAGTFLTSALLCGGTALLLRQVGQGWSKIMALTTLTAGVVLVWSQNLVSAPAG